MGYEWALFSFEISGLEKRITYFGHGVIDDDQRKISTFNLLSYTNSSATHQPFLK